MNIVECLKNQDDAFLGKGCEKKTICEYEKDMNVSFAKDYKEYLEKIGLVAYDGHELTGIGGNQRVDVKKVTEEMKKTHSVPDDYYVVEDTNMDGIVIWQSSDGVVYLSKPESKLVKICESLVEYVNNY